MSSIEAPVVEGLDAGAVFRLLEGRRSVRRFQDRPVDVGTIRDLLQVAAWAPSPHNSQPWRFTILRPAAKADLAAAMAARLRTDLERACVPKEEIDRQAARSLERITGAPAAVLLSIVTQGLELTGEGEQDALEIQMAVQSTGGVLQNLFLAAYAVGLGSCWMAAPMYCPQEVRNTLRLPGEYRPQALVLLGYAAQPAKTKDRRRQDEIVDIR